MKRLLLPVLIALLWIPEADAQQWSWPERGENLQVLPATFSGQRIGAVMRGFTRALGVRCSHCHVGQEGQSLSEYDFVSDDNPNKEKARVMLRMLGDINNTLGTLGVPDNERINMWCHTCHRGTPRPGTLDEMLLMTYHADGAEAMIAEYRQLREEHYGRAAYDFSEPTLNGLGYQLLAQEDHAAAIAIFKMNAEFFPESSNAFDSLAEAYMESGQDELAEIFYRKALELDPANTNSLEQLRALKSH